MSASILKALSVLNPSKDDLVKNMSPNNSILNLSSSLHSKERMICSADDKMNKINKDSFILDVKENVNT